MGELRHRWTRWSLDRTERADSALLEGRNRELSLWTTARFVVALAALQLTVWPPKDSVWYMLGVVLLGGMLGQWAAIRLSRATARQIGYLDGRRQMWASLHESWERGLSYDEWVEGELERDLRHLS